MLLLLLLLPRRQFTSIPTVMCEFLRNSVSPPPHPLSVPHLRPFYITSLFFKHPFVLGLCTDESSMFSVLFSLSTHPDHRSSTIHRTFGILSQKQTSTQFLIIEMLEQLLTALNELRVSRDTREKMVHSTDEQLRTQLYEEPQNVENVPIELVPCNSSYSFSHVSAFMM